MNWVDIEELKVGDNVRIRHQEIELLGVDISEEWIVTLTGETEDGRTVVYAGLAGEAIQRLSEGED